MATARRGFLVFQSAGFLTVRGVGSSTLFTAGLGSVTNPGAGRLTITVIGSITRATTAGVGSREAMAFDFGAAPTSTFISVMVTLVGVLGPTVEAVTAVVIDPGVDRVEVIPGPVAKDVSEGS